MEQARRQAEILRKHDPQAAAMLLTQIAASEAEAKAGLPVFPERVERHAYRIAYYYALMAKHCGWSWQQSRTTDWRYFFAILRELGVLAEEEKARSDDEARRIREQSSGPQMSGEVEAEIAQLIGPRHSYLPTDLPNGALPMSAPF